MKTLSTPIENEIAATQAGWCEVYDIYLKSAITTPFGSVSTLRLTALPGGLSFFTPVVEPEPGATQGDAQTYSFWPLKRGTVSVDAANGEKKQLFGASNVTAEWATMLDAVDWYDTPVVIRKVSTTIVGATADDCAILFIGLIDECEVTNEQINFSCSQGLGSLGTVLPRENMHANCRFNWADDLCTAIRFKTGNYAAKTVGASSTTTLVKSADFTEDVGAISGDLIDPLSDANITASSAKSPHVNTAVSADSAHDWLDFPAAHEITEDEPFQLSGTTAPVGLSFGVTYYALVRTSTKIRVRATPGGAYINFTTSGTSVKVSTLNSYDGYQVKSSNASHWVLGSSAAWGTLSHGYWQIPDAQAGIANADLEPYVQFDMGSKTLRMWKVMSLAGATRLEDLPRLLVLFSSTDAVTWELERYMEMPPVGGQLVTFHNHGAQSRQYWRLCVRSRWATTFSPIMLAQVEAYAMGRNWWANGQLKFDANTATAALRNVTRRVLTSAPGQCTVPLLPVAPASGDTFVIERGCPRTFNGCAERENVENFGGFTDLPNQTIIR
jgi:phage-related protein